MFGSLCLMNQFLARKIHSKIASRLKFFSLVYTFSNWDNDPTESHRKNFIFHSLRLLPLVTLHVPICCINKIHTAFPFNLATIV